LNATRGDDAAAVRRDRTRRRDDVAIRDDDDVSVGAADITKV
jgi:hypothetical protein